MFDTPTLIFVVGFLLGWLGHVVFTEKTRKLRSNLLVELATKSKEMVTTNEALRTEVAKLKEALDEYKHAAWERDKYQG